MAFLKKAAPAAEFRVPTLAEASAEYAGLVEKRRELLARQATLKVERRELEQKIAEAPAPLIRASVAELLGDASDSTPALHLRLGDVQKLERDVEAALEIIRQRLTVARTAASRTICEAVRPEYGRRVAAICDALNGVAAARSAYDALRDEFDREDVAWGSLTPLVPSFLGDARDGHIQRYIKDAREAGYVG